MTAPWMGLADLGGLLRCSAEVREALAAGRAVVALESTVIAHGLPPPENVQTAVELEFLVRAQGAVPATVAAVDGVLRVGLGPEELARLGSGKEPVAKLSSRDLAVALARRGLGATTVAGTLVAARLAGIRVFATGGIGGVHRGAEASFDISADLAELARSPVAVVSAGAKSVLDLARTLEVLETLGIPVLGYRTDRFPAFYTRDSGHGVDARVDSPGDLARLCWTHWRLGLATGLLVAQPLPEAAALDPAPLEAAIEAALAEAQAEGVRGKELTPVLLARLRTLTGGRALAANLALLRANAVLAGQLAAAYAALSPDGGPRRKGRA